MSAFLKEREERENFVSVSWQQKDIFITDVCVCVCVMNQQSELLESEKSYSVI